MIMQKMKDLLVGRKTYNDVIEASYSTFLIRKVFGTAVMVTELRSGNTVIRKFCPTGFLLFILWNSVYLFCMYKVFNQNQTIVNYLFSTTKLRRYGDDYEKISSFLCSLFLMVVTPFKLSGSNLFLQKVFDIDKALKDSGETIDYNKIPMRTLAVFFGQVTFYVIQLISHCLFINYYRSKPISERLFTNIYTDCQALVITWTFMYYVLILRDRFEIIKQALIRIRDGNIWKCNVFHRIEASNDLTKVLQLSDKEICEKIRSCAKLYTMLCKSTCLLMKIVGLPVHVCFLVYELYMILYFFYLIEATQLSSKFTKLIECIFFCGWGLVLCFCVIVFVIYFSETTMKEVVHIRYVIHDIINENISPSVNKEAMQFSMELLHVKPVFSVLGLYELNYELVFEGAKTITTYLVILLQFVTGGDQ